MWLKRFIMSDQELSIVIAALNQRAMHFSNVMRDEKTLSSDRKGYLNLMNDTVAVRDKYVSRRLARIERQDNTKAFWEGMK